MKKKSILFVNPDYHCSFIYRDELRKKGWRADIYVPSWYPEKLLYSKKDIVRPIKYIGAFKRKKIYKLLKKVKLNVQIEKIQSIIHFLNLCRKYRFLLCYGGLDQFDYLDRYYLKNNNRLNPSRFSLGLAKKMGCKIIQLPSGCLEEETKANFSKLDNGNVCGNCGWSEEVCNDKANIARFDLIRKYADMVVGTGSLDSSQYHATHFKYKAIDLSIWSPEMIIPKKFLLPKSKSIRILHSFYNKDREHGQKNIKGSPYILDAIEKLKSEGFNVESMYLTDVSNKDMRFYQAQADIVVDQLIYGWWGSTSIETMALAKPVVCYLRPEWKKFFFRTFPEYTELPIVEANTSNIYDILKRLVVDNEYRKKLGEKSRKFAEQHFDSGKNAEELSDLLLKL